MQDGNFSKGLPGCGFYAVITHVVTVKSVFSVPVHIETCLYLTEKLSDSNFEFHVTSEKVVFTILDYNLYTACYNVNLSCKITHAIILITHPTLPTAIFSAVSKQTRRVVTKSERS